jgi:hypothetical protein
LFTSVILRRCGNVEPSIVYVAYDTNHFIRERFGLFVSVVEEKMLSQRVFVPDVSACETLVDNHDPLRPFGVQFVKCAPL